MDFWGTVLVLARRWYVAVPAFLAAVGAAFYAYSTVPITYTTTAVLLLTAPNSGGTLPSDPDLPLPRVNPLLNFDHGLEVAASILISVMSTPDMVAEMGVTSEGPTKYAVTNGTNNLESLATGPLVFVEGESRSPREATAIVHKAVARIRQELDTRQRQVRAPAGTYITISEAVPPTSPAPQQGRKLRSAAAALGLGMIASLCAAFAAESLAAPLGARFARRRPLRARRHDDGETPQTETPQTETHSAETPRTETPSAETPRTETPSAETPRTETPSAETPRTETPSAETPRTETPSAETPRTETPSAETPRTETPSAETPRTETPETSDMSETSEAGKTGA